jgi:hypothetical protein
VHVDLDEDGEEGGAGRAGAERLPAVSLRDSSVEGRVWGPPGVTARALGPDKPLEKNVKVLEPLSEQRPATFAPRERARRPISAAVPQLVTRAAASGADYARGARAGRGRGGGGGADAGAGRDAGGREGHDAARGVARDHPARRAGLPHRSAAPLPPPARSRTARPRRVPCSPAPRARARATAGWASYARARAQQWRGCAR